MHEAPPGTSAGILDSLPGKDACISPALPLLRPSKIPAFSLAAASAHQFDFTQSMSPLQSILTTYRATSQSEREKPALEWVMERQSVTTDKHSGIANDANLWATETMGNSNYPLELFLRVVTVGLETMITTPQGMFFSHAFGAR